MEPDFYCVNHGSIFVLTPLTEAAQAWVSENLPEDAPTWGNSIVVEHRYIGEIVAGLTADGLRI
jgi:hypothetical protein